MIHGGNLVDIYPAAIALARESRGWTQTDLASATGVSQGKICKYELGLLKTPESEIEVISKVLRYDRSFFDRAEQISGLGGDFLYRKKANLQAKVKRRVQAEANIRKIQVERLLQSGQMQPVFPFPTIQPEDFDGPVYRIATQVREAWRLPNGPVRNVTKIIEGAGGIVFKMNFESDLIDGTNLRLPGLPPLLFLNENVSGERHRFNLAHELAHTVMHFSVSLGDAEDQANEFAREFLLPRTEVRSDLKNLDLVAATRLKSVWGVSMALLIVRAKELNQISPATYRRLFTALGAKGYRRTEPLPVAMEQPETFDRLVSWHRENLGFSTDDIRRLLFTDSLGSIPVTDPPPRMRLVGSLFG